MWPIAFAIPRFAFGNHIAQGNWRNDFTGNRLVALHGEQEISCSGRVIRSAEDFILVLLQNVDPRADIRGVLLGVMWNSSFRSQKHARQLSPQLLLRIADIAEPVGVGEGSAIQPRRVATPVGKLMQCRAVIASGVLESLP